MADKVRSLSAALEIVADGCHVALGGFAITRCVMPAVHHLARAGRRRLTVSQTIAGLDTDVLVGAGCVSKLIYAGGSLDRFGSLYAVSEAVSHGEVETEEYSSLAMTLRFHSGALNLPFIPCRSLLGSDLIPPLLAAGTAHVQPDPFTGRPTLLLAPLRPDVAILHVDTSDPDGNATLAGPTWTTRETAFAASHVVLLCEEVVDQVPPDQALIPGSVVDAVVELPCAAHPTAVAGRYDYDRAHLEAYTALARKGPAGMRAYLERYVLSVPDHSAYLAIARGDVDG